MGEPASRDVTHVSLARFSEMAQTMCSTPDRRPAAFGSVDALVVRVATVEADDVIGRRLLLEEYGFDGALDLIVDASPRTPLEVPFVCVLLDLLERAC